VLLSLLVCWIGQARTLARQQRASNNLRQMGLQLQEQQNTAIGTTNRSGPGAFGHFASEWSGQNP